MTSPADSSPGTAIADMRESTAIRPKAWYKGMPSPNPAGQPKSQVALLRKAIKAVDADLSIVVGKLYGIISDATERARDRVMAAQLVLAYAVGRPEVAVKVSTGDGSGMTVGFLASVDVLPDDKLRELAAMGLGADVLDAESVEQGDDDER